METYEVLPSTAGTTIITNLLTVVGDNIAPILAVLGFMVGLFFVLRLFRHSVKGRV